MTPARSPRWLMSFADLCLLLLGFFVLLHARADGSAAAASVRAAFGGARGPAATAEAPAARWFVAGEAVLSGQGARDLARLGRAFAHGTRRVRVASRGADGGGARFDGWELAAARAAAAARALAAAGVAPGRIDLAMPVGAGHAGPQRLTVGPA